MEQYPFPHVVIDNFLPAKELKNVLDLFPEKTSPIWKKKECATSKKMYINHLDKYTDEQYALFSRFNGCWYINKFEKLTGIDPLIPDPYLTGAGFHCIERGGFLGIHADFNLHPKTGLYRKLNVLVYLNDDWQDEWGGQLELWDFKKKKCIKKISPIMNRAVVFETSRYSLHGHSKPLACPENRCRKSIALYYYVKDVPEDDRERHSTIYI